MTRFTLLPVELLADTSYNIDVMSTRSTTNAAAHSNDDDAPAANEKSSTSFATKGNPIAPTQKATIPT